MWVYLPLVWALLVVIYRFCLLFSEIPCLICSLSYQVQFLRLNCRKVLTICKDLSKQNCQWCLLLCLRAFIYFFPFFAGGGSEFTEPNIQRMQWEFHRTFCNKGNAGNNPILLPCVHTWFQDFFFAHVPIRGIFVFFNKVRPGIFGLTCAFHVRPTPTFAKKTERRRKNIPPILYSCTVGCAYCKKL